MIGIILIVFGIISLGVGIYLYSKPANRHHTITNEKDLEKVIEMAIADGVLTPNERELIKSAAVEVGIDSDKVIKDVEERLTKRSEKSETAIIDQDKKSGDDFEKFIVKKFNKKYFSVKEWAGDKYADGVYAETTLHPDLIMEILVGKESVQFAVECKWRRTLKNGGVEFASKEQLKRYKAFGKERNIPVYVALGLGGEGEQPKELFILPLQEISNNKISREALKKYFKNLDKDFYYDIKKKELS